MGVPVSYIRKYDSKLQIEMLRAYRPDRFKTAGVNVNIGAKGDSSYGGTTPRITEIDQAFQRAKNFAVS